MPKIEVSREDLFALSRIQDQGDDRLADLLTLVKGEIDSSTGDRLKIELNDTNRPDLWCVEGIARALRCHESGPQQHLSHLGSPVVEIEVDPGLEYVRPYVAAFTASGWGPSAEELEALIEVQEKLTSSYGRNRRTAAIGFYRLDEIEFPVRYRAVTPDRLFIPLGSDEEMTLARIASDTETGRMYSPLVSDSDLWPILEDGAGSVLSFPPVINSQTTGRVRAGDSRLFCEVTGTDWETVQLTATILACNLQDRGADIIPARILYPDGYPVETMISPIVFGDTMVASVSRIEAVLGIELSLEESAEALRKMDYADVTIEGDELTGVLPPYRRDGMHTVDMIEDIAISMGIDSFSPLLPESFTIGRGAPVEELADAVRTVLVGAGCEEIMRPVLSSYRKIREVSATPLEPVKILNPMTAEYGVVRNTLIPGLLEVESTSANAAYPHRLFESGEVLISADDGTCSTEILLACLVCGNKADFGDVHSIIGALCHARGSEMSLESWEDGRFIPGRCATVLVDGLESGVIGEIHPAILSGWGITRPAAGFEIRLTSLG